MDESHFTFMVFCYSLCKDNGRRHLVIRGRIKELLSSPFWLTTKPFLFHHFLFSLFFLPAIISNYLEINELLLHLKKVLRVLFYPAKMWARASTVWRATICVKEERPSFFFFFQKTLTVSAVSVGLRKCWVPWMCSSHYTVRSPVALLKRVAFERRYDTIFH